VYLYAPQADSFQYHIYYLSTHTLASYSRTGYDSFFKYPHSTKDCANVVKICKSLVDIIQLGSWNDETAASGALWALAGLQYGEGKMTAALEGWGDRYVEDEASDLVGDAAGEDADEEEFSGSDVEMDVDPSQVSTTGPLRNVSVTNTC
jgi:hypothetical protein